MSGIGGTPTSAALDQFLRDSYDVVQAVHRELDSIKAVASHLTPVEDLIEFQNEVVALHAKLGVLVHASELLVAATDAGVDLLVAPDAPAQRALLELKSAALEEASFFATATAFDALSVQVGTLSDNLDAALLVLANKVDRDELTAALAGIGTRFEGIEGDLGTGVGVVDARVTELITQLQDGTFVSASAVALEALTTRVTQAEAGITTTSQRTTALESKVTNLQTGATGQADALNQLTTRVTANETGVTSLATNVLALTTQASNLADGQTAQTAAIQSLSSRTTVAEGQIDAQAEALTQLDAKATDAKNQATVAASAISGLEVRVQSGEAGQLALASDISQLDVRISDTETGLQAQAQAANALMARVTDTEQGLDIAGEERTVLRASLTGTGNHLPNTAFAVGLRGWELFSRGDGWLDAVLERNAAPTLPNALPESMLALSLTQDEVPSGSAGIRCADIPVEDLASYILSGYIAAENCTVRLEWRLFNAADEEIGLGVVGTTTKAPTARLSDWDRPWGVINIPADGVYLQVHVWVVDCNTGYPKAWLIRPMLEPRTEGMEGPSPWMDGMAGVEETYATAVQSLETRVTETEDSLDVLAQSVTDLTAVVGGSQEWRITHHSGSGDFISVGSPMSPGIRKATSVAPSYNLTRGLTVLRFDAQNALLSATPFDTYGNVAERNALRDLLMSFTEQDTFLLVSQNHHGVKQADLTSALERCGALLFKDVLGSRPYVLAGRGLAGAGGGIEYVAPANAQWQDIYITTVNGVPQGMGNGMSEVVSGQASAIDSLTAEVTTQGNDITSLSTQVTELTADVASVQTGISTQGAALSDLGVRVSSTEAEVSTLSSSVTTLSGRMDQANTDISAQGSAIGGLSTRMTSAEGNISSISSDVTALEATVTGVLGDVDALGTASSQLSTRVDAVEGTVTGISNNVTTLSGRVNATESDLVAQGNALDSLTTRVTSNEGLLASQADAITAISSELSAVGGTNLLPNSGMEEGITATRPRHWIASNTAGVTAVESRVSSTLTQSQWAYRLYHAALAKNTYLGVYSYNGDGEAFPKIEGSKPYVLSSNIKATPGMELRIYFQARDASGAVLQTVTSDPVNGTGGYRRIELRIPSTHPDAVSCSVHAGRVINTTAGTTAAYIEVDNVQLQEGLLATSWQPSILYGDKVTASAVDALTTRVTNAEGVNSTQATQITNLQTDVAGKASSSALQTLETRVTNAENVNTSQGSSITSINSSLSSKDFLAGNGTNLVWSEFSRFTSTLPPKNSSVVTVTTVAATGSAGGYVLQGTTGGTATGGDWCYLGTSSGDYNLPTPAGNYILSFEASANVAGHKIAIVVKASNGVTYGTPSIALTTSMARYSAAMTLPAGVTGSVLLVYFNSSGVAGRVVKLDRLMIEPQIGSNTTPSTWSPGPTNRQMDAANTAIGTKADASALSALTTRVTSAEGTITSQGNSLTTLSNKVNNATTGLDSKASNTALSALDSRVTTAEGTITSHGSSLTSLDSRLDTAETDIDGIISTNSAQATAISGLETRVTAAEGVNTSQGSSIVSLNNSIGDLTAQGMDLVRNGLGQAGDNRNFQSFTFDPSDRPPGSSGSFVTPVGNSNISSNDFIPVDPSRVYRITQQIRQRVPGIGENARYYAGVVSYDAFKNAITPSYVVFQTGTTTTLTQDLKPGDLVMKVASSAGWNNTGAQSFQRSAIFWNYVDPSGYEWPPETYSRNYYGDLYAIGGITGNTITLKTPWAASAGTIPAGTAVSNGGSGGTYIYAVGSGNSPIPDEWTEIEGKIGGIGPPGPIAHNYKDANDVYALTPAAAFVKLIWLPNRSVSGPAHPTSQMAVANVSMRDWSVAFDPTLASASALTALTTRVTNAEGVNTSQGSAITALDNRLDTVEGDVATKASSSALSALDSRVTAAEGQITAQGDSIVSLESSIEATSSGLKLVARKNHFDDDWAVTTGAAVETSYVAEPSAASGYVLRIGNNAGNDQVWATGSKTIPLDPNKLYRVRIRVKRQSGTGVIYAGLAGINADKTHFVTKANGLSVLTGNTSHHYTVTAATPTALTEYVAYFKGRSAGAGGGTGTIADPYTFAAQVAHITPALVANYNNLAGETDFDYAIIEDADALGANATTSTALTALTTRVTNAEGVNTSQASSITSLTAVQEYAAQGINYADPSKWVPGTAVPANDAYGNWTAGGWTAEHSIVTGGQDGAPFGPFGGSELMMQGVEAGNSSWSAYLVRTLNPGVLKSSKSYAVAIYAYMEATGGTLYLGTAASRVRNVSDGTINGNPYFFSTSAGPNSGKWVLMYGVLHPATRTITVESGLSGCYDVVTGAKITTGVDYVLDATVDANAFNIRGGLNASSAGNKIWLTRPMIMALESAPTPQEMCSLDAMLNSKASASALTALETRVTNTEGVNTTQASQITQLQTDVAGKASASAVSALEARVTTTESGLTTYYAAYTLTLDVNGKVSGFKSVNDGATSSFEVLTDKFKVISGGATGLDLDKTRMDRRFGSMAAYEGDPFGTDSLVMWIGPATTAKSAATKANGTFWISASGTTGGGTMIPTPGSGIYKTATSTSQPAISATTASIPRTAGKAREITATMSTPGANGIRFANNGSGTTQFSVPFVVEVSRDGGAWTQVGSSGFCSGSVTRNNSEPGSTSYSGGGSGSITVYDEENSGTNLQYRVRETSILPSITGWGSALAHTVSVRVLEVSG